MPRPPVGKRPCVILTIVGLFSLYVIQDSNKLTQSFIPATKLSPNETRAVQRAVAAVEALKGLKGLTSPNDILYGPEDEDEEAKSVDLVEGQETRDEQSLMGDFASTTISDPSAWTELSTISSADPFNMTQLNFIDRSLLDYQDMFSATWWQSIDSFLQVNLTTIGDVEGASFQQFYIRESRVKLTVNYLDFAVEHLSKWWQAVYNRGMYRQWEDHPGRYDLVMQGLQRFCESHMRASSNVLAVHDSIVLIAFQPYNGESKDLTVLSLSATIASLYRQGFGRIVVVGKDPIIDSWFVRQSLYKLQQVLHGKGYHLKPTASADGSNVTLLGQTQVAFVQAHWIWSTFVPSNIPKGALVGFRKAIEGIGSKKDIHNWLGADVKRWKYVMLTEPDTLLSLKTHLVPGFLTMMDNGFIFAPHRLQPIPHEYDFVKGNATVRDFVLPAVGNLTNVTELSGACCDAGARIPETYPRQRDVNGCESFWWLCALGNPKEKNVTNNSTQGHERIFDYYLMNLTHGTGFVLIAGTEHGRKCIPQPEDVTECPVSQAKKALTNDPSDKEIEILAVEEEPDDTPVRIQPKTNRTRANVAAPKFINQSLLHYRDMFAGSWWQSVDSFLEVNLSTIGTVEDACFQQFYDRESRVKLTVNFLDMAVEHLSKWWQAAYQYLDWNSFPGRYDLLIAGLTKYCDSQMHMTSPHHDSIALIAFQPYSKETKELTVVSLSATIASLYNQGFGRIVVVGENTTKETWYTRQAFFKLEQVLNGKPYDPFPSVHRPSAIHMLNHTQVSFVEAHATWSEHVATNIPKGALEGFRSAISGELNQADTTLWLGSEHKRWSYILLTEPDTLLTIKPILIPAFLNAMDDGYILAPHRLQPIPHEYDFISEASPERAAMIPALGNFTNVTQISSACCDTGPPPPIPDANRKPDQNGCENFWWICALGDEEDEPHAPNNSTVGHERLFDFHLMNLTYGSGFVLVAGTEHGRKCIPQPPGVTVCDG